MKRLVLALLSLAAIGQLNAATGVFGSYIQVMTTGNTVYELQDYGGPNLTDFAGTNFGTINYAGGTPLTITNASLLTFKGGGGDVTGAQLFYRIWKQGNTAPGFTQANLNFGNNAPNTDLGGASFGGGGDQEWRGLSGGSINLLSSIPQNTSSIGNWSFEVYMRATTNEGDRFSNNGGGNFIANFSVIPEPSRVLLAGIGLVGMVLRRRRK
jgi:hypothetical protein